MSNEKPGKMKAEQKKLTATQLFSKYMQAVDKVRGLAMALAAETQKAEELSTTLANEFGIYVTGQQPRAALRGRASDPAPEDGPVVDGSDYKPPAQHHADAPQLSGKGSQEVADIRREAGLDVAAGDTEELANQGVGMMTQLQEGMKGTPEVVAVPGEHAERGAPQGRSNAEGGPVKQGPVKEE